LSPFDFSGGGRFPGTNGSRTHRWRESRAEPYNTVQRLKAASRRCLAAGWLDGSSGEPANSFSRKVPGR
jgi:hypothetical protein